MGPSFWPNLASLKPVPELELRDWGFHSGIQRDGEKNEPEHNADEGSRDGKYTGGLDVAAGNSGDSNLEMRMRAVQGRAIPGESDEKGVAMTGLTVEFANFTRDPVAWRGAVLLFGGAAPDFLACARKYPIGPENRLGGAAFNWVGIDSEKAVQLIGRDGRLGFDLDEVETVKVESEV